MKRTLNLYILIAVFVSSLAISIIMLVHGNLIFKEIATNEKQQVTHQISNELSLFQTFLGLIENQFLSESKPKIEIAAQRISSKWETPEEVPLDTLQLTLFETGVDEIFLINNSGIVKNATLAAELGYDLKKEGDDFFSDFKNLFNTHTFKLESWGISSIDNAWNIYSYYVPQNCNYAFETEVDLSNYLKKIQNTQHSISIENQLKSIISSHDDLIKNIDLYNLNDASKTSLVNVNKTIDLDAGEMGLLEQNGNYSRNKKNGEIYYSIIDVKESYTGFPPKLILQVDFDYSKQIEYIKHVVTFNIIILIILIILVGLASPWLIHKIFLHKIDIINYNLSALRLADYDSLRSFKGNDELSAIAENINHVKDSVVEREKQFKEAKSMAEAADKLKSAFLANMSHEIRTPLNAVVGFSQLLRDANPTPNDVIKYVGLINTNSNKLLQIINDIIDLSQIESGMLKIFFKPVCLHELFTELYALAQSKLHSENLIYNNKTLTIHVDNAKIPKGTCINSDPYRLKQIMEQLIDNAIKFTCTGEIRIGYKFIDQILELYVSDTGVGIAEENISKIFGRFVQAEDYMTREFGGTGLGLAICTEMARLLGGVISVKSKLNEGSTFSVQLPNVNILK